MAGGRIIITVMRSILFPIRFIVFGVVIIIFVGTIKEGAAVAVLYVKVTWVALRQTVNSGVYEA